MTAKTSLKRQQELEFELERLKTRLAEAERALAEGQNAISLKDELFQDITERKRAEDVLRESEERYRSLFENMLEGYAYCQMFFEHGQPPDFVYIAVNPAFETLTGLKDVVGKKVSQVIPGIHESNPELFEIYGRVALTGQPEKFETYVPALGIWFSISVFSPAKEHFVAVFDNITERKQVEKKMKQQLEELQRWHDLTLDRETRSLELKREVNELLRRLQEPIRYLSVEV